MVEQVSLWLVATIGRLGYAGLVMLMAMESSVLPLPSELVMPPAGYLAFQGKMNLWLALGSGILGSVLGAYINYWVAARLGRWVFVRYGRFVLLSEKSLERTERFFAAHGEIATFVARLFPVIRHLISIPAGLARMRLSKFFGYTAAGAGIWCGVLLGIGWLIGRLGEGRSSAELDEYARRYAHHAVLWMVPLCALLIAGYIVWHRRRTSRAATVRG